MATQQGNMELGTPPVACAKRVVALPLEGALSQRHTSEARLRGEAPAALPLEGALSPNNCEVTMASIFKAYDIRGTYPHEVNEAIAFKVGASFVKLLAASTIVIGYDMRLSSPTLADAFAQGAMSAGARVTNIGMVTTPLLYFAIIDGAYDGGAMVTASHLPGESNGFKLCREKAIPVSSDAGLPGIERMVNDMTGDTPAGQSGACSRQSVLPAYLDRLKTFVHDPMPIKMVIDAGNGAVGPEVLPLTQQFPMWQVVPLYMEPDGRFPHHVANPLIPKNTEDLRAMVVEEKADIGIAFDGDADRCGFIDEKGEQDTGGPGDSPHQPGLPHEIAWGHDPLRPQIEPIGGGDDHPSRRTGHTLQGRPRLHKGRYEGARRDLCRRALRPLLLQGCGFHR